MFEALIRHNKDVAVWRHAGLAMLSMAILLASYCTPQWVGQRRLPMLFMAAPKEVTSVLWGEDDQSIELVVTEGQVQEVLIGSAEATAKPSVARRRFRPSAEADAVLRRLAPLAAVRSLGQQDKAHLQSFGLLQEPAPRLRLKSLRQNVELTFGRVVFGTSDMYARLDNTGVYLVDSSLLRPFDHQGAMLTDRHLIEPQNAPVGFIQIERANNIWLFERDGSGAWPKPSHFGASYLVTTLFATEFLDFDGYGRSDAQEHSPCSVILGTSAAKPDDIAQMTFHFGEPTTATSHALPDSVRLSPSAAASLREAIDKLIGAEDVAESSLPKKPQNR